MCEKGILINHNKIIIIAYMVSIHLKTISISTYRKAKKFKAIDRLIEGN
jgi:hypothetical protein